MPSHSFLGTQSPKHFEKTTRCWLRSVKSPAVLACKKLHETKVAATFIA